MYFCVSCTNLLYCRVLSCRVSVGLMFVMRIYLQKQKETLEISVGYIDQRLQSLVIKTTNPSLVAWSKKVTRQRPAFANAHLSNLQLGIFIHDRFQNSLENSLGSNLYGKIRIFSTTSTKYKFVEKSFKLF